MARAKPRGGTGAGQGNGSSARPGGATGSGPRKPGSIPAPRRPAASENIGSPELLAGPDQGKGAAASARPLKPVGSTSEGAGPLGRFVRDVVVVTRSHPLEVLAVVLLGVGGAAYPPIWLVGVALALPSKKWDIRDKFLGITLPVLLLIIGTVLILVLGGEHASLSAYAYEAWLGAERLSRVLAAAGAVYLAWGLRRGKRQPKQPPWNVPHRLG